MIATIRTCSWCFSHQQRGYQARYVSSECWELHDRFHHCPRVDGTQVSTMQACNMWETSRTLTPSKLLNWIVLPYSLVQRSKNTEASLASTCRMFPKSQFELGDPGRSVKGFEMLSRHMSLMSLYSVKVPRIKVAWQLLELNTGMICDADRFIKGWHGKVCALASSFFVDYILQIRRSISIGVFNCFSPSEDSAQYHPQKSNFMCLNFRTRKHSSEQTVKGSMTSVGILRGV